MLRNSEVIAVINTVSGDSKTLQDGFKIRRLAIDHHVPLITNLQIAQLMLQCLARLHSKDLPVRSWSEYMKNNSGIS